MTEVAIERTLEREEKVKIKDIIVKRHNTNKN